MKNVASGVLTSLVSDVKRIISCATPFDAT